MKNNWRGCISKFSWFNSRPGGSTVEHLTPAVFNGAIKRLRVQVTSGSLLGCVGLAHNCFLAKMDHFGPFLLPYDCLCQRYFDVHYTKGPASLIRHCTLGSMCHGAYACSISHVLQTSNLLKQSVPWQEIYLYSKALQGHCTSLPVNFTRPAGKAGALVTQLAAEANAVLNIHEVPYSSVHGCATAQGMLMYVCDKAKSVFSNMSVCND